MRRNPLECVLAPRDVRQIVPAAEHANAKVEERVAGRIDEIVPLAALLEMEEASLLQTELSPCSRDAAEVVETHALAGEVSGKV